MKTGHTALIPLVAAAVLMFGGQDVQAEHRDAAPLDFQFNRSDWYTIDAEMSPEDYQRACRKNQRAARRALTNYSKQALTSLGVPEMGVKFMGTAVGLATRTTRFHVNESKTMAFELKDVMYGDRSLMFGINIDW